MSDSHRQKLLNWFCTMLLLLLVCALSLCVSWRTITIYMGVVGGHAEIDRFAGPLGEAFCPYFLYFPLLAIWHFFGFLESERDPQRWRGWFTRYRSFLTLLLLAAPFTVLSAVNGHISDICSSPQAKNGFGFRGNCEPETLQTLVFYLFVVPLVLMTCISKANTAIRSRLPGKD